MFHSCLRPIIAILCIAQLAGCASSFNRVDIAKVEKEADAKMPLAAHDPSAAEAESLLAKSLKSQPLSYGDLLTARALWTKTQQDENTKESPTQTYRRAKALCWLDAALFEFTQGRSNDFREHAYRQALKLRLVADHVADTSRQQSQAFYGMPIKGDATLTTLQKQNIIDAKTEKSIISAKADPDWGCAAAALACSEVALIHASSLNAPEFSALAPNILAFSQKQLAQAHAEIQQCKTPAPVMKQVSTPPEPVTSPNITETPDYFPAPATIAVIEISPPSPTEAATVLDKPAEAAPTQFLLINDTRSATQTAPNHNEQGALSAHEVVYFLWGRAQLGDLHPDSAKKIEALADRIINRTLQVVGINLYGKSDPRERNAALADTRSQSVARYLTTLLNAKGVPLPTLKILRSTAKQEDEKKNRVDIELIIP